MSQLLQPPPAHQPQPQQISQPKAKKPRKSTNVKQPEPAPFIIQTFTLEMRPLSDISRYPEYCRKDEKEKASNPIIRARRIFDTGTAVPKGQDCSRCLEHNQICIRGPNFSKCCYCTAEDLHPKEMCHLPGIADPPEEKLSLTALSKKRKMDARTEAASATTTFESAYGQSQFQISNPAKRVRGLTEFPVSKPESPKPLEFTAQDTLSVPQSIPRSIVPSPNVTSANTSADTTLVNALLEKITAMESRVSTLEKLHVEPDTDTNSGAEITTATLPATTPSPSWGIIPDILRVHDKNGDLI